MCIFPSKFLITFAPKNIQEKNLCTWNKIIFFKERETNFLSKKKLWEAHEKLRFFRQNFLKSQLCWIFLTCIPSSIAKPNRICTHKKIHLDFAYYSKKLQRLFRKKIIAFFPDFSTILAKKKNNYASYVFRLQLERCFFRQSVITTSSKNALILHVLKEYSYSSDVSKKKKNFFSVRKKLQFVLPRIY